MRFFNTAGPVNCADHYCISPLKRGNLDEILFLIEQKKYFVLHAPRQTGKTSCLLALMRYLNEQGRYACLYMNVETAQPAREDVDAAMKTILSALADKARTYLDDAYVDEHRDNLLKREGGFRAFEQMLRTWCAHSSKPIVLMIDEVDSLVGDTLISLLRQLRSGYAERPAGFPQSVILCGVRDVRDYRIHSSREKTVITGGSTFNIKAKSLRLGDFSRDEVERLYGCHTKETGQRFEPDAIDLIWDRKNASNASLNRFSPAKTNRNT